MKIKVESCILTAIPESLYDMEKIVLFVQGVASKEEPREKRQYNTKSACPRCGKLCKKKGLKKHIVWHNRKDMYGPTGRQIKTSIIT